MKKSFVLSALFLLLIITTGFAQNPIPSYYQPVLGTETFLENGSRIVPLADERREMNVESSNPGDSPFSGATATVYIIRRDGVKTLGPFFLNEGGIITAKIDAKPWYVVVNSTTTTFNVSVYTKKITD